MLEQVKILLDNCDHKGLLEFVNGPITERFGVNHDVKNSFWSSAMILNYGPIGLHESYFNVDGSLNEEALKLPCVVDSIERAKEMIGCLLYFLG